MFYQLFRFLHRLQLLSERPDDYDSWRKFIASSIQEMNACKNSKIPHIYPVDFIESLKLAWGCLGNDVLGIYSKIPEPYAKHLFGILPITAADGSPLSMNSFVFDDVLSVASPVSSFSGKGENVTTGDDISKSKKRRIRRKNVQNST